jgi:ADP-ribosylation factor-like protein 5B
MVWCSNIIYLNVAVEEVVYKNIRFQMWDLGGQESLRSSWAVYYVNTQAVIMVVDSTDRSRIHIVRDELVKILTQQDLSKSAILVFANKQDLKGAMSAAEVSKALNLHLVKDHDWHIQACCALTGAGLMQGMDWLVDKIGKK